MESTWNTRPQARDLKRSFFGLVADGLASQWNEEGTLLHADYFSNGNFRGSPVAQPANK
jgi:hypothetical protein